MHLSPIERHILIGPTRHPPSTIFRTTFGDSADATSHPTTKILFRSIVECARGSFSAGDKIAGADTFLRLAATNPAGVVSISLVCFWVEFAFSRLMLLDQQDHGR